MAPTRATSVSCSPEPPSWPAESSTTACSFARSGRPESRTTGTAMPEPSDELILDRLIHEPARLAILTVLSSVRDADFVFLQRATGLTKGNLSSHLDRKRTRLNSSHLVISYAVFC